jgi:hypothetical protein
MGFSIVKIILVIFALALGSMAWSTPKKDAIVFVSETGLGNNLSSLALRVANNMETYSVIVEKIGESKASTLVNKHVRKSVENHQDEWNENMASSYLEYFSTIELNSILTEKSVSPYFSKFRRKQKDVGASMQKKSNKLLQRVVSRAMKKAFTESESL